MRYPTLSYVCEQIGGRCAIYAVASVILEFTGKIISHKILNEWFLKAGGKEDTEARDGAIKLPQALKVVKDEGFIKDYKQSFINLTPNLQRSAKVMEKLENAKQEMISVVSKPDVAVVIGIFYGNEGLKLDKYGAMLPSDWARYHAIYVEGTKIVNGKQAWKCKNS